MGSQGQSRPRRVKQMWHCQQLAAQASRQSSNASYNPRLASLNLREAQAFTEASLPCIKSTPLNSACISSLHTSHTPVHSHRPVQRHVCSHLGNLYIQSPCLVEKPLTHPCTASARSWSCSLAALPGAPSAAPRTHCCGWSAASCWHPPAECPAPVGCPATSAGAPARAAWWPSAATNHAGPHDRTQQMHD